MANILQNAQKRAMIDSEDKYVFNDIYFGAEGLTSASAQHVSAMANVLAKDVKIRLIGLHLYEKSIRVIGEEETVTEMVTNNLSDMIDNVKLISKANALIAWLREAIKERQAGIDAITNMTMEEWMQLHDREMPVAPEVPQSPKVNFQDLEAILGTGLTIKEYNRFLELGSTLAVYGELIHEKGLLTTHKAELARRINNPTEVKESGRDTIITTYRVDANAMADIQKVYDELQRDYRELQAERNGIEAKFQELAAKYQQQQMDEYRNAMTQYRKDMEAWSLEKKTIELEMAEWKKREMDRLVALKIIIPKDLLEIYCLLRETYL